MNCHSPSLDPLCRWKVQVSVYCVRRIPAHLRCIQCTILLHLIDICFIPCICLWQISKIPTCLCVVVGLGFACANNVIVAQSPSEAKSLGSNVKGFKKSVWDSEKEDVMLDLLRVKFSPNSPLADEQQYNSISNLDLYTHLFTNLNQV